MKNIFFLIGFVLFISCSEKQKFRLIKPEHTGIHFINTITETDSLHVMNFEYIYNGAGVGIADLNDDGLQDIVFSGNMVSPGIYLNRGNFQFQEITSAFEGLSNNQWFSGVTIADINSDRLPDVYFTSTFDNDPKKRKNRLWVNHGIDDKKVPRFKEMAEKFGIADEGYSVHAAFLDYDLDGDLDLYVMNNIFNKNVITRYRPKIIDGTADNNDKFYRNNGDGKFTDITIEAGIVIEGYGLGIAVSDFNKDGYPDIYISNDYIANDLLYLNQKDGTFRNVIGRYLSYQTKSSMGNDVADMNNDGFTDILTLDMLPESYHKKRQTINGFSYIYYVNDELYGFEHQHLRNMLHLSNGLLDGELLPFSEVGQMMDVYHSEWSWSPLFADYDNDGDKDLIIANGYPKDLTDKDWTFYKMKTYELTASAQHVMGRAPAVKVSNIAFLNTDHFKLVNVSDKWLPQIPSYSNGASFVDLDNDGDLDYVTNNIDDKAFVYRNYTIERSAKQSNYIKIKLTGDEGNTMGIGAKVELWSGGNYQYHEHFLTRGYASSIYPIVHFGLSDYHMIDSIKVTWPETGNVSLLKNIESNQTIEVAEASSESGNSLKIVLPDDNMLFKRRNDIIEYKHVQGDYMDFSYHQVIIPHKFSQIGPKMAKGDLNGDGMEDLLIGSTNKLPTTAFLWNGDYFEQTDLEGLTIKKEFSESDMVILDVDGDGDNDVIAIAGGYENMKNSEYVHYLYLNEEGTFKRQPLPVPPFIASIVKPFDFDHDGDLDLFIGARVVKARFPYAPESWLLINENGEYSVNQKSEFNLGMVTDAVWSDYDRDGWEDLIVTREWNTVIILKNINGREMAVQDHADLQIKNGIWYSIINLDLDLDGDDDYILGNLGDNHRFTVSSEYPLTIYSLDIDMDGNVDPVTTAYWEDQHGNMKEYPVNYLDELAAQSTFFKQKFKDYTSFSYTAMDEIFDEQILNRVDLKLHVNTTSSYILWNEKGKLVWEKLPVALQVAPIKKMVTGNFDGNKFPDVLITGNDHTYDVATGYYDSNKGFTILNIGDPSSFKVLHPSQSGFFLHGMVESLLYFKGKSPLIVAGINRRDVVVYESVSKEK
ncbi:MAG: VCBS repeat-containing protein [Cyclobacteriaceae bacterium]|nr:VCBS repeat-containing protein [Cyclobacteriaceae bacterium]